MVDLRNEDYSLFKILFHPIDFFFSNSFQLITLYWNIEDSYGDHLNMYT